MNVVDELRIHPRGKKESIFQDARRAGDMSLSLIEGAPPEVITSKLGNAFCDALTKEVDDAESWKYLRWLLDHLHDLEMHESRQNGVQDDPFPRADRRRSAKLMELLSTNERVTALRRHPFTVQTALVELARQLKDTSDEEEADLIFSWFMWWSKILEKGEKLKEVLRATLTWYFPLARLERCLLRLRRTVTSDENFSYTLYECFAAGLGKGLGHLNEFASVLSLLLTVNRFPDRALQAVEDAAQKVRDVEETAKNLGAAIAKMRPIIPISGVRYQLFPRLKFEVRIELGTGIACSSEFCDSLYEEFGRPISECAQQLRDPSIEQNLFFVVERIDKEMLLFTDENGDRTHSCSYLIT